MPTRQELLAQLLAQQQNMAYRVGRDHRLPHDMAYRVGRDEKLGQPVSPTGASVDRNRMMAQILETGVAPPKQLPGMIAPVDASMVAALANIGTKIWGARKQQQADEESRELLARELELARGKDPFASDLQPIVPPSLRGIGPREGPGAEEATAAQQSGILPFVEAVRATKAAEAPARAEHDVAALLDPRASALAATRISSETTPAAWSEPYVDDATGAVLQRNRTTGEVREVSRPPSLGGENSRYGSPQITQSGRLVALDRREGRSVYTDTGEPWDSSRDPVSADLKLHTLPDGSTILVDTRRHIGTGGAPRTEQVVDPETAIAGAAARAGAEQSAKEEAETAAIPARTRTEAHAKDFADAPRRIEAARDIIRNVNDLDQVFDRVLKNADHWTVGFASIAKVPGSPQANLAADLQTLQANAAFDRLQQMRESSPTGGALGAISEREIDLLQSTVAALEQSQSPEQFKQNIERLRERYRSIRQTAQDAQRLDSIKARISTIESRPQTPENQRQIEGLYQRLYAEEDKLWARLDTYDTEQRMSGPDGGVTRAEGTDRKTDVATADDPLASIPPEVRAKYGL